MIAECRHSSVEAPEKPSLGYIGPVSSIGPLFGCHCPNI